MSRHTPRKERWTQVSAKEYRSAFGMVCYKAGAWEGAVVFERWTEGEIRRGSLTRSVPAVSSGRATP